MDRRKTAVVFSPHLDDAVLSALPRLLQSAVQVVTVFAEAALHLGGDTAQWDRFLRYELARRPA